MVKSCQRIADSGFHALQTHPDDAASGHTKLLVTVLLLSQSVHYTQVTSSPPIRCNTCIGCCDSVSAVNTQFGLAVLPTREQGGGVNSDTECYVVFSVCGHNICRLGA